MDDVTDIIVNYDKMKQPNRPSRSKTRGKGPSKKSAKHGYKFESETLKSLERLQLDYPEIWYYKMVDTYSYDWIKSVLRELEQLLEKLNSLNYVRKRFNNDIVRIRQILQTLQKFVVPKVPADIFILYNMRALVIECKSSQRKGGFVPFEPYVSEHQIDASRKIEGSGVPYYFFICDRTVPREHKGHMIRSLRLLEMREWCNSEHRRTIPWSRLREYADWTLPKLKGQVFDLEGIMKHLK